MYLEQYDLSGRVAVVTGGGRGIGREIAGALAEAGALIVIAEIDPTTGKAAAQALADAGRPAEFVELDVTRPQDVERAAGEIQGRYGRIDVLVANAGVAVNTPAEDTSDEEWRRVVDLNLNGVFWCNRAFGRPMLQAGRGSIVNVGSMSGIIANKPQPQAHYNATKAAVHMLTKSLAGRMGAARRPGQRGGADLHRDRDDQARHDQSRVARAVARDDADAPGRPAAEIARSCCSWPPTRPR